MNRATLFQQIQEKQSYLCVGLDPDLQRLPKHLLETSDPIFEFNKQIIDHTKDYCIAYKPNVAFYESLGSKGWEALEKTLDYIPDSHFTIADAKRGDIGNTSRLYAKAFFERLSFDAITVAPYMGEDSVRPFLEFDNKWVILLALTSNKGSQNFQFNQQSDQRPLYLNVLEKAQEWGTPEQLMFVVGATHPQQFEEIRAVASEHFLLVPGIGAQGGDLAAVTKLGRNDHLGLLVNSSRGIIFAGTGEDYGLRAGEAAQNLQGQMAALLAKSKVQ